ncbi:hypothetical protein FSF32_023585 [Escherichia coli]|uniref:hypothetical protein n=1 Tax=Escherichia coli TaxID=562 RepID=UPI003F66E834|nr:hypothetical protein [Escherichia coli]
MSREGSLDLLQEVEESLDIMRQTQHIKPVKVKAILENLLDLPLYFQTPVIT